MQFKVPQKIDMEDKIIGPLTKKQFVYLLVGGMITYATIKSYNVTLIAFLGVPVGLIALALAFIKVQDQSFSKFLVSLLYFFVKPRRRYWHKEWQMEAQKSVVVAGKESQTVQKTGGKLVERKELERLSVILDTKGEEAIKKVSRQSN